MNIKRAFIAAGAVAGVLVSSVAVADVTSANIVG